MNELNRYDNNKWKMDEMRYSGSRGYGLGKGGNGIVYHSSDGSVYGYHIYRISDVELKEW